MRGREITKKLLYIFTIVCCLFLIHQLIIWPNSLSSFKIGALKYLPNYYSHKDELALHSSVHLLRKSVKSEPCTMLSCFDFTKCSGEFRIYVYPLGKEMKISSNYANILKSVTRSRFYTEDPTEACLFVPSLDTLDRDKLSKDYQRCLMKKLNALPYWNNGKNHLIFNLYSGSHPDYKDRLDLDTGNAILVKASTSSETFRKKFDISLPLFSKTHPLNATGYLPKSENIFPLIRKYWASFKGKRYLKGIGSKTRDDLYKLHNGKDIILLTTCKHGKYWRQFQDRRCRRDNELYERYDFQELLHNSTFCLAPRGRRLGSFRFLESLSVSCIPVLLANSYELPFSEVIDWKKAVMNVDERRLFELGLILERISERDMALYRQQNQFLWQAYFSSVEKIVFTVIEIMHHRVQRQVSVSYNAWNSFPGALVSLPNAALHSIVVHGPSPKFTAIILVKLFKKLKNLVELSRNISKADFVDKIVVIWTVSASIPEESLWPSRTDFVKIKTVSDFHDLSWKPHVTTDAIFIVDNFAKVEPTEINLAFSVWKMFPHRLTGLFACSHFWNDKSAQWSYTRKIGSHHDEGYSMVIPSVAFYHRYYGGLHTEYFSRAIQSKIKNYDDCQDISLNFLISHVTRLPPIKILKHDPLRSRTNTAAIKYSVRNECFQLMKDVFGYIPLLYSKVTFVFDKAG